MESSSQLVVIIGKVAQEHDIYLRRYAKNKFGSLGDDYLNDVYLKLTTYNKLESIYNNGVVRHVIIRMLGQAHINDIRKNKHELPQEHIEVEDVAEKSIFEDLMKIIEGLDTNIIEDQILKELKTKTIQQISDEYEVPYFYIYRKIEKLKKICEEQATLLNQ